MENKVGDKVVEEGTYKIIADTENGFQITHVVLKSGESNRVWRVNEISDKNISFNIEKFG